MANEKQKYVYLVPNAFPFSEIKKPYERGCIYMTCANMVDFYEQNVCCKMYEQNVDLSSHAIIVTRKGSTFLSNEPGTTTLCTHYV